MEGKTNLNHIVLFHLKILWGVRIVNMASIIQESEGIDGDTHLNRYKIIIFIVIIVLMG